MRRVATIVEAIAGRVAAVRQGALVPVLVALLALAAFLPGFTTLPPLDRDEARFAQATKQMMLSGDPVDIRFQDEARYKKPVGIYWLQAAAVAVTGAAGDRAIWHYRLPSLIAAVLAAALTARIATGFGGGAAGLAAGLLMAGTILLGAEARLAKTDAVLLLTILAAQAVLAGLYHGARAGGFAAPPLPRWRWVGFWVALGLSALVKGPVGPGIVALAAAALALGHRRFRWLGALQPLPGLGILLAIVAPWLIAITWKSGGAFWAEALGHDMLAKLAGAQESHGAPPGSYLGLLWLTFQPGAPALALALPAIWRSRAAPGIAFAAAWAIPGWIGFEAAPTKLMHYVLPFYPALALAVGLVWAGVVAAPPRLWRRITFWGLGALPLLLWAALAGLALSKGALPVLPLALSLAVMAAGLALARTALAGGAALAAMVGLWLLGAGLNAAVFPGLARIPALWPAPRIAALIPPAPDCATRMLWVAGYEEPSLVFLAPGPVRPATAAAAMDALADPCALALVPEGTASGGAEALGTVRGTNLGTGKAVALVLYRGAAGG